MSSEATLRFKLNKKLKLATEKLRIRTEGRKKSRVNNKQKPEMDGKLNSVNSDQRKKRVYGGRDVDRQVALLDDADTTNRKVLSKRGQSKVNVFVMEKINENSSRTMWNSSRIHSVTSKTKRASGKTKSALESAQISDKKMRTKVNEVDGVDGNEHSLSKKRTKSKSDSSNSVNKAARNKKPSMVI